MQVFAKKWAVVRFTGALLLRLSPVALLVGAAGCTASASTSGGSCSTDSSVSCSSGTGWSCSGSAQPQDTNSDIVCSTDGAGDFCCASSSCSYDSSVVGCQSGSVGYSCASGSAPPDQSDATLVCSEPTSNGGSDDYCCYTNATTAPSGATCAEDSSVMGCQPGSFGFSCTGSDTPDMDFSNITCSAGTPGTDASGATATLFCCAE